MVKIFKSLLGILSNVIRKAGLIYKLIQLSMQNTISQWFRDYVMDSSQTEINSEYYFITTKYITTLLLVISC